ncbi:hypothetical protein [Taklimakanibacter deserti]|uniref:hypothetical protein n=1 Tax=Taklimakanibacter deserti TaxID=2267839 RepID=UPI0034D4960F
MLKLFAVTAAVVTLSMAAADANAWTREGSATGPRGTYTVQGSGSCYAGVCTRQVTRTGPNGQSWTTQGAMRCAHGVCRGRSVTTGPYGRSFRRWGWVAR